MISFFEDLLKDINSMIPNLVCNVREKEEAYLFRLGYLDCILEEITVSKELEFEDLLITIMSEISDMVSEAEPTGIVIEPELECTFHNCDPFFDNMDEHSGGYYAGYTAKECMKMVGRVTKYLALVGKLEIQKQNLKNGVFMKLVNPDIDYRLSLRFAESEGAPVLLLRFGDYHNFKVTTNVVDGTRKEGQMLFMASEFISTLLTTMSQLSQKLILVRHRNFSKSARFTQHLFSELGWKETTKPRKKKKTFECPQDK